jgi:hypothetical protein
MSASYGPPPRTTVNVRAGTAFKLGFFGALGAFVLWLVVTIVLGVLGLILAAAGLLTNFWSQFTR